MTTNESTETQYKTIEMVEGTIDTESSSNTITSSVTTEVSKSFVAVSASVGHEWQVS